jgi:hypothetical protein
VSGFFMCVSLLGMWKRILLVLMVGTLIIGCEKTIDISPDTQAPKLVVDAQIEATQAPIVLLSKSLSFFSTIDTATLYGSFIKDAKVSITDGVVTHQLRFYDIRTSSGERILYYSNDMANPSTAILGVEGKSYELKVEWNGNRYSGITRIPVLSKKIDSLFWKRVPNRPVTDSFVVLMATATDPPGLGNYIRYFTNVNRQPYYPGYNSVFDDDVIDGKTYTVSVDRGVDKNQLLERDNYGFFKKGDTVTVKFSNIDKATYDFWRTWEFSFQSNGNPFSSPGVVIGNMSNGALGAFCGYSSQFKTIIIPK